MNQLEISNQQRLSPPSIGVTLTVETAAWAAVVLLALVLRMAGLAHRPMSPAEAEQAWAALDFLGGQPGTSALTVSPLLLSLHSITFGVASASEVLARLWPVLAGTLAVLLPYGLRHDLGRAGALFASLLLALSTSLLFWSRSATGESLAVLGGLGLVVGLAHLRRAPSSRWALFSMAMLSLVLLSGSLGYSVLILVAPVAFLAWRSRRRSEEDDRAAVGKTDLVGAAVLFGALLLLGSTAMLFYPRGLAVLADLPGHWLAQFRGSSGYSPLQLVIHLVLTEPLLVAAGLTGLFLGVRQRDWLAEGLGIWLALALLLLLVRAGRTPGDVALLVVPLALLGGKSVALLASTFVLREQVLEAAVLLVAGMAIVGSIAIWLANYVASWPTGPQSVFLVSALAALGVLLGILIFYVFLFGTRFAVQVGFLLLLLVLGLLGLRAAMRVNHNSDGLVWDSLLQRTGATDARNLPAYLERLSAQRGGDLRDLDVAILVQPGNEPPAMLRWYLRGADVRQVAGAGDANRETVLVGLWDGQLLADGRYSGKSFRLAQHWTPQGLRGEALWRWLLYGHFDQIQGEERAIVWLPVTN